MKPIEIPEDISGDEEQVQYAMSVTGILRRKISLEGKWWKDGSMPLLCWHETGEIRALIPAAGGGYIWIQGEDTVKVTKKNAGGFRDTAYCIYRPFESRSLTIKDFWRFLAQSFSRADILCLLGISLVVGLIGLILPSITQFIFNFVVPSGTPDTLFGITVLLVGTTVISAIMGLSRTLWVMRIGNKLELNAQGAVWARIMSLPTGFFKEYDSGEMTSRANSVNQICTILGGAMIPTLLGSMFSFLYLFQITQIHSSMLLPSLVIIILLLGVSLLTAYYQMIQTKAENEVSNKLSGMVFQFLDGITKIKVAGAEVRAFRKWADLYSRQPLIPGKFLQMSTALTNFVSFGGTIVLYLTAYSREMSTSQYIAFNSAFAAFTASVLALSGLASQISSLRPAVDMLKPILEAAPESDGIKKQIGELEGEIEVNQVRFRYNEDMPYVLDELSLHIKPGEYLGIVGSSGCGKSTLFRLLLGFEKPESGAVYFDGNDLAGVDVRSVRQKIGVVLQNGKLFSGDIYSNIVICAPWLTIEDAWNAAEKAGFAEDIRNMPMGMFTMISEGGGGLSGGQQQRLLIARALVADPSILMFDEATSALDNITQAIVVKSLEETRCTRIVIAHRLSTIRNCSRIVYLHQGKVAESGTYEELMSMDGMFAQMAKRQLV
ncbi:MAG: NHLP bacteriocin export ABC transporter permease/ATPase subunit [Eubacteriales bacterium]|nr:NHLP bacteriocin export ABC transporter permease/ATPase subunit [Eubacteriales bacterium]